MVPWFQILGTRVPVPDYKAAEPKASRSLFLTVPLRHWKEPVIIRKNDTQALAPS
jgi:hypothetical protein